MDLKSLINELINDPAAQDPQDKALIERLVAAFESVLEDRDIEPTPFVVLRLHDVITQYRLARRIEAAVFAEGIVNTPQPEPNSATKPDTNGTKRRPAVKDTGLHPGLDALTKAWDRVRKALHDLEAACAPDKGGRIPSLADVAAPLLERADGVIEQALEAENERQREVDTLRSRNRELIAKLERP